MQNGNTESALRARLAEVAKRYPQSEIARRTGCPTSSVSRYLAGNRIPATFVASVATEFGANPAWLLTGQGAPWLADTVAEESRMGAGMLEMVQSMERVSRLRLGALAGRGHAKALRGLNDALESFERVRNQLAGQTRETYISILKEWLESIQIEDRPRMRRLATAAEQVSRLCPEPELSRKHDKIRAAHESILGNTERALTLRRRVFLASIPDSGELDSHSLQAAFGVVAALDSLGRTEEAVRFAEAALKLAPRAQKLDGYGACLGTYGWALVATGRLSRGIGAASVALSHPMHEGMRDNVRFAVAYGQYLAGGIDLAGASMLVKHSPLGIARLMFLAPWSVDEKQVAELLALHQRQGQTETAEREGRIARAHLYSLRGRHAKALAEWAKAESDEEARKHNPIGLDFTLAVMRTHLLHRSDRAAEARKSLEAAEAARAAAGPITLDLNWRRVHWRNAQALGMAGPQAARFERFCARRGIQLAINGPGPGW